MSYLSIPNWDELQHYKDRSPPWIKLHNKLLENYEFECLQDASKAHLILIGLLASRTGNKIKDDPGWIGRKIGANSKVNIESLVVAGLLIRTQETSTLQTVEQVDSNTLAECKQDACLEREGEQRRERGEREQSRIVEAPLDVRQENWIAFLGVRKKLKAENSEYALKLISKKLIKFKNSGYDVNSIIETSIENSWKSVFEPKNGTNNNKPRVSNKPPVQGENGVPIQDAIEIPNNDYLRL